MAYKANTSDLVIIGNNLKFERNKANMTITQFSKYIKYDRAMYSKLEGHQGQDMSLNKLVSIAKELDVDVSVLLSRSYVDDPELRSGSSFVEKDYLELLVNNLKLEIEKNNCSQEGVGQNRETVNRLLNFHIRNPRITTISFIAAELGTNLSKLFKGGE